MKENMTKTFSFGKIDYYGKGRKINAVTVEDLKKELAEIKEELAKTRQDMLN